MKYWYMVIHKQDTVGWCIWRGTDPLDRLIEKPNELITWWQEISKETAEKVQKVLNDKI